LFFYWNFIENMVSTKKKKAPEEKEKKQVVRKTPRARLLSKVKKTTIKQNKDGVVCTKALIKRIVPHFTSQGGKKYYNNPQFMMLFHALLEQQQLIMIDKANEITKLRGKQTIGADEYNTAVRNTNGFF